MDWAWNATTTTYTTSRIFSNDVILNFLGGKVWTFKPAAPFKIYVSIVVR